MRHHHAHLQRLVATTAGKCPRAAVAQVAAQKPLWVHLRMVAAGAAAGRHRQSSRAGCAVRRAWMFQAMKVRPWWKLQGIKQ